MAVTAEILRELHRIHRQLADLNGRKERGPKQIKAGEANVARFLETLKQAQEVAKRTEMTVREKELQLKEREGRIEDLKRRLNSCATNREYQAILEQIAADETANSVLSDEILELFDKNAKDAEEIGLAKKNVEKSQQDLESIKARVVGERDTLDNEIQRLESDLAAAAAKLPGDVRPEYQRRAQAMGEEALAPLEDEYCGGCYQKVTPQMLNEVRLAKLVICKSCGRLLYEPEETAE